MNPEDWRVVLGTEVFRSIGEAEARALLERSQVRTLARGAMLFQQGDPAEAFFVVLDGWIKLYRENVDGEEIVVTVFSRGDSFAEAVMFMGGRYPVSAQAVTPTRVLRVDGRTLRARILERPELAFSILGAAFAHLRGLLEHIEQIKGRSGPQRLAEFLVRLAQVREGATVIGLPYEKGLIAGRLGMQPESLSRALAKLRELGVTVSGDTVAIADVRALGVFAQTGDPTACRAVAAGRPRS